MSTSVQTLTTDVDDTRLLCFNINEKTRADVMADLDFRARIEDMLINDRETWERLAC